MTTFTTELEAALNRAGLTVLLTRDYHAMLAELATMKQESRQGSGAAEEHY